MPRTVEGAYWALKTWLCREGEREGERERKETGKRRRKRAKKEKGKEQKGKTGWWFFPGLLSLCPKSEVADGGETLAKKAWPSIWRRGVAAFRFQLRKVVG